MKKSVKFLAIAISGVLMASCTINKPQDPVRTITVHGSGNASATPDLISLKFLVRTNEWNVNLATEKNATITNKVLDALKTTGVDQSDISTINYAISQDNSNTYPGKYTVLNTVSVLVRNTEITSKVIDIAVANGASGLTSFEYKLSDSASTLRQSRTAAIQNAQDAASLLAGASGCKLGNVMDIKETPAMFTSLKKKDATTTEIVPVEETKISITTNVTVTYSLTN